MNQTPGLQSAGLRGVVDYLKQTKDELVRFDDHSVAFKDRGAHEKICEIRREANPEECSGKLITFFSKDIGIGAKLADAIERLEETIG